MMTREDVRALVTPAQALTLTLFGEGRGEPVWGRIAIGGVIRNRALAIAGPGPWMAQVVPVCFARWQFSCWEPKGGLDNHQYLLRVADAVLHGTLPTWSPIERAIYDETCWITDGLLAGVIRDPVKRARHYYAPDAMTPPGTVPEWAQGRTPVLRLGRHLFFVGVA